MFRKINQSKPNRFVFILKWNIFNGFFNYSNRLNPRSNHTKDLKMVLDTSLFNTQPYKVCINGDVEQSRERSSALPNTLV